MNRNARLPLFAAALALAACGAPPPLDDTTELPAAPAPVGPAACDARITSISPSGALPVARTATVYLKLAGHARADSVKVQIAGVDGAVHGGVTLSPGLIEVRPDAPLPVGAQLLQASVCDSHEARGFEVGAVHHALGADQWQALAGRRFGLDLRYATWLEPASLAGRELIVRTLLGGALVVDLEDAADGALVASIAPGTLADGGEVQRAGAGSRSAPLVVENPYALASFGDLAFEVGGRRLILREGTLVLGFTDDGIEDARLSAQLDVRDFGEVDGLAACALLALHTGEGCQPCPGDGAESCVPLTLQGLASVR